MGFHISKSSSVSSLTYPFQPSRHFSSHPFHLIFGLLHIVLPHSAVLSALWANQPIPVVYTLTAQQELVTIFVVPIHCHILHSVHISFVFSRNVTYFSEQLVSVYYNYLSLLSLCKCHSGVRLSCKPQLGHLHTTLFSLSSYSCI